MSINLKKFFGIKFIIFNVLLVVYALSVVFYHYETIWTNSLKIKSKKTSVNKYEIKYFGEQNQTSYVTLVTSLFQPDKSKHSPRDYEKWTDTMLKSIGSPIVAFVDVQWSDFVVRQFTANNLTGKQIFFCGFKFKYNNLKND